MSGKFGNILTMILVVLIVAILGIIGYFAYDMLNTNKINNDAQTALEEFEKATIAVKRDTSNLSNSKEAKNEVENTVTTQADPLAELDRLMQNVTKEEEVEQTPQEENVEPEKVYLEGYEVKGRIEIPKTKVDYPILGENTKRSLEIGITIAYGPGLNEEGNTCLYGHNYRNNLFFSNNDKLSNGDDIYITDQWGERVRYKIYNMYQTDPNDASYMQRPIEPGKREISLQTCTDDSSGRIIIWAEEYKN